MKLNINNPVQCEAGWPCRVTSFITRAEFLLIDPTVKAVEDLIMSLEYPVPPNKVKRLQYKSKEVSFANCAFEKICCC